MWYIYCIHIQGSGPWTKMATERVCNIHIHVYMYKYCKHIHVYVHAKVAGYGIYTDLCQNGRLRNACLSLYRTPLYKVVGTGPRTKTSVYMWYIYCIHIQGSGPWTKIATERVCERERVTGMYACIHTERGTEGKSRFAEPICRMGETLSWPKALFDDRSMA